MSDDRLSSRDIDALTTDVHNNVAGYYRTQALQGNILAGIALSVIDQIRRVANLGVLDQIEGAIERGLARDAIELQIKAGSTRVKDGRTQLELRVDVAEILATDELVAQKVALAQEAGPPELRRVPDASLGDRFIGTQRTTENPAVRGAHAVGGGLETGGNVRKFGE